MIMMKMLLAFMGIALASSYVAGQNNNKRRAVKTGTANGIFSPAIITGDLVYTSGQIGIDSKTGQLAEGFEAQLEQVFKNLTAVLDASGSSIDHVVKATVFLADMNDYNKLNELYPKKFKGDPPARTCVQVARLPRDARVEIEVVAVLK
ncbi:MAG TPA: Rid family detoxifying hydrolase [Pyrinomonadaceae bacterium]|nr:Rid family detoxifying hydrolase [Pyrinomonadaceae bacterium]